MFTGIILGKGTVVEKKSSGSGMIFSLESDFDLIDPEEGESIAVNEPFEKFKRKIRFRKVKTAGAFNPAKSGA